MATVEAPHPPTQLGESKILSVHFVKKPAHRGSIGRKIQLFANHFKIDIKPFTVHQYDLSIDRIGAMPDREKDADLKDKAFVKWDSSYIQVKINLS